MVESPLVAPGCTLAMRLPRLTLTPRIADRSTTIPPSQVPSPATFRQRECPLSRDFSGPAHHVGAASACQEATQGDAVRRGVPEMCPKCVRVFYTQTTIKCRFAGTLGKPSDGLEP